MKTGTFIVSIALAIAVVAGCRFNVTMFDGFRFDYGGEQASRTESGSFPEGLEQVFIENRFGTVQVESTESGDQGWSWELTTWADSTEVAEEFTEQIELKFEERDNTGRWLLVLPEPPQSRLRGVRSNLVLNVPASVAVEINNRGDVVAKDLAGTVKVDNSHGDVALRDLAGQCVVSNEHGEVAAANLATAKLSNRHGPLTAEGVSGDLDVRSEHGSVKVSEVSGDLVARNRHGKIEAHRIGGNVDADCEHNHIIVSEATGNAKLRNRHGQIRADHIQGSIDADNEHGKIDLRVESTSVKCKGSHASIKLALLNPAVESVTAETSHASIDVTLPKDLEASIVATAEHGDVRSEFPVVASNESRFQFETRHGNIRIRKGSTSPTTPQ